MRYVSSAAAIAIALSTLAPSTVFGEAGSSNFSITNYQFVSDQRATRTQWYVTYKADLVNTGPALPGVTATVTSLASSVQIVAGQSTLHFAPVPANSQVTSSDNFTLLVDRTVSFDWSYLKWSFLNPVAHRALPLNYFKARKEFSSGVVEGLNNKAKVTLMPSCKKPLWRAK